MTMDTSFKLLLIVAGAFGLAAADHYLFANGIAALLRTVF